jgi:hypothetical protein
LKLYFWPTYGIGPPQSMKKAGALLLGYKRAPGPKDVMLLSAAKGAQAVVLGKEVKARAPHRMWCS